MAKARVELENKLKAMTKTLSSPLYKRFSLLLAVPSGSKMASNIMYRTEEVKYLAEARRRPGMISVSINLITITKMLSTLSQRYLRQGVRYG